MHVNGLTGIIRNYFNTYSSPKFFLKLLTKELLIKLVWRQTVSQSSVEHTLSRNNQCWYLKIIQKWELFCLDD